MITFEVNGREYRIRDFMTLATWDNFRVIPDDIERAKVLLFENLLDVNGNQYENIDAMMRTVALVDSAGIRKTIWQNNGVKDTDEDEDSDPLPQQIDSVTG